MFKNTTVILSLEFDISAIEGYMSESENTNELYSRQTSTFLNLRVTRSELYLKENCNKPRLLQAM